MFHILIFVVLLPALIVGAYLWLYRRFGAPRVAGARRPAVSRWGRMRDVVTDSLMGSGIVARLMRRLNGEGDPAPVPAAATAAAPPSGSAPLRPPPPGPLPEDDTVASAEEVEGVLTAPIPGPWAALIAWITTREPESDGQHREFLQGDAAAFLGLADAFRAYGDTCIHSIGMDPAAVQGTLELADVVGDNAHDATLALRRYLVTYAAIMEAISSGIVLPHNARQFFGESEAA